ncbi:MAG: flagellar biosynthesis protein FlhF [Spirochaetaceae bacterium]|jgi:flagellar biosynthesis protein FlhF|nr:flagellar biosynthesis protein FlhF [Spirochaetaceae bacterium]
MECFVEQGSSYNDCLSKIIAKYGDRVQIVTQRNIRVGGIFGLFTREGVEMEFYIPPYFSKSYAGYGGGRPGGAASFASPAPSLNSGGLKSPGPANAKEPGLSRAPVDFEEAKKKVLAAAGKDSTQMMILNEVRNIKEKIEAAGTAARKEDHPALARITEILEQNDFSSAYINAILDRGRKEFSLEALEDFDGVQDKVLEWIGESIRIYQKPAYHKTPRIMVLVGPTGVGKTTTTAKLAAIFGLGNPGKPARPVRIITIDAFRIGAKAQIEAYGDIMDIPVAYVDNYDDLKKEIALSAEDADIVLVDTIGKSPRDSAKLGEMKELLDACGFQAEVYLVIAAGVKSSDILEILRQFEPFNYRSVILTKLDETTRVGNVISALSEKGKSLAYITDGQKVPTDIHRASVVRFLLNLEDFRVNREKMEKQFPVDKADQF